MRRVLLLALIALAVVGFSLPAMAIGVGGSFTAGVAKVYWVSGGGSGEGDGSVYGGSLVFDTALAQNSLFNYRANFAIQALESDTEGGDTKYKTEGMRFALYNSFGFGVVRTESIRLWMGPQFGVHYIDADTTKTQPDFTLVRVGASYVSVPTESKRKSEDNGGGVSLGFVLGVNFNIGPALTLGLDGGCRAFVTGNDVGANAGPEGFMNVSVIFRINDSY